ncbi:MAG TPA: ABC transporter permease [Anaerolineales bacterium]|nr:ABC transporter permease [Anaerolineales bacterium]
MNNFKKNLQEIARYPSAIVGSVVILILIGVAIYTMIAIPYQKAIALWRGGEDVWYQNPKTVPPEWFNLFSSKKEPISFVINAKKGNLVRTVKTHSDGSSTITMTYTFDYKYDDFPQDINLYFNSTFVKKQPFASLEWQTPDGRKIQVANFAVPSQFTYRVSQDAVLQTKLKGVSPQIALFANPKSPNPKKPVPVKGTYKLVITGIAWEKNSDVSAEMVFLGQLSGLAGTDFYRRDLMVALLWGVPVALAFGLIASVGTTVLTMVISAIGAWYGRWVDGLIQRITEVNLVLPFLPILIMIGTLFSRSIWVILGVTVALSIFTGQIKAYRAIFMQVKETTYIEAAKAYGASNWRIITLYLIPRMIPTLIPSLVLSVPSFVFLEASLAVLGLGDPTLPTWGKIIDDAFNYGALYKGLYYWILEPAVLLMITGLAFALLGFALDRIFNPRLREA